MGESVIVVGRAEDSDVSETVVELVVAEEVVGEPGTVVGRADDCEVGAQTVMELVVAEEGVGERGIVVGRADDGKVGETVVELAWNNEQGSSQIRGLFLSS